MTEVPRIVMIGDFPRDESNIGGGVESVMLYLSQALSREGGFDLHVMTLDRWGLGGRDVRLHGLRVHYVPRTSLRGPVSRLINRKRLARKLRDLAPDLVHVHIAGQYASATRMAGLPYVLTLHGIRYLEADLRSGWLDRHYRRHLARWEEESSVAAAPYIISINPFIEETFAGVLTGKVSDICNPVSDDFFHVPDVQTATDLLYVGRITPRKDILSLLEAFRMARAERPSISLRLAGAADTADGGSYLSTVSRFLEQHDLARSVDLLGNLDEESLLREYADCSLLVMSSVLETAPMSIAQSLAAGRGVITTDAGGCRHMIEPGVSGRVVPVGDAAELARAIVESTRSFEVVQRLGHSARRLALDVFRPDKIAARTVALYREILDAS